MTDEKMGDLVLVRHNLTNFPRDIALLKVPDLVKKCAKMGVLILSTPECRWWIGKRVKPFDIEELKIVEVKV